jgi:predicted enzyme related to lactoylglutathione lyase
VPTWFELHTRSYDAELDFYKTVFGWETQPMPDTPGFRYSIVVDGQDRLAGVMDDSAFGGESGPSYWLVYFGVEDADKAVARAQELGGTVARPAEDTPYGRLASIKDPTGAAFNLMGPNEAMSFDRPREQSAAAR